MENIISFLPKWEHLLGACLAFIIPYSISKVSKWLRSIKSS